jgi:hypothetical protein
MFFQKILFRRALIGPRLQGRSMTAQDFLEFQDRPIVSECWCRSCFPRRKALEQGMQFDPLVIAAACKRGMGEVPPTSSLISVIVCAVFRRVITFNLLQNCVGAVK